MQRVVILLRAVALVVTLASLAGCAGSPRGPLAFASWRTANAAQVMAFERHLGEQGVAEVLPLHQLLRSASSWRECASEPFALPPPEQWGAAVSVLRLLQALQAAGVVGTELEVHSAYRGPVLNACAQGAAGSAHLRSFALDFTLPAGPDPTGRLCAFWREQGRAWRMGLSRYPSGRIHIDTAGFRTWAPTIRGGLRCVNHGRSRGRVTQAAEFPQPNACRWGLNTTSHTWPSGSWK